MSSTSNAVLTGQYFCMLPGGLQVKHFVEQTKQEARSRGYITTLAGRRRPISSPNSGAKGLGLATSQRGSGEADRKAVNSTVQGSAADLVKLAMCSWAAWQHAHWGTGLCLLMRPAVQHISTGWQKLTYIICAVLLHMCRPCVCAEPCVLCMSSLIRCSHECLTHTDAAGNGCPVRLVAQIHDELLFEVNAQLCDVYVVAGKSLTCPIDSFLFIVP